MVGVLLFGFWGARLGVDSGVRLVCCSCGGLRVHGRGAPCLPTRNAIETWRGGKARDRNSYGCSREMTAVKGTITGGGLRK